MRRSRGVLRLIAAFRLLKAALLIAAGFGVLRLLHGDVADRLRRWADALPFAYIHRALMKLTRLPPERYQLLAVAAFAYAALFIVEGVGLWMEKRWAEWLTLIATASFIPFEIYEIVKKATAVRVVVLALNVAIGVYLAIRLKTKGARDP
jgi:uncharacterized membrane protein (DUF2068 family)